MSHMYNPETLQEETEVLEHAGTKGMHWYERKYQNPDGTYTELGKERRREQYAATVKAKKEAAEKEKNESHIGEEKIGGKAYKDMSRRERRQARKRARHNEAERRRIREFNRDKREAIQKGDLKFLSKHRSELSDDEIVTAIDRYRRIKSLDTLERAEQQEKEDRYFNKAMRFLDKTSQVSNVAKRIYTDVKDMQTKHYTTERERLNNVKAVRDMERDARKEIRDIRNDELDYKNKLFNYNKAKEDREFDKKKRDEDREWDTSKRKEDRDYDVAKRNLDFLKSEDEYLYAPTKRAMEIADAKRKAEKWDYDKKELDYYNKHPEERNKKGANKDEVKKWFEEWSKNNALTGQPSKSKLGSWFKKYKEDDDRERYEDYLRRSNDDSKRNSKTYDDLDDLTSKYMNNLYNKYNNKYGSSKKEKTSIHDILPITEERDKRWKKERSSGNSYKVDKWVNEMKRKYMKERNLSAAEAEELAEDYVDAWIDFYGKQRKR